MSRCFAYSQTLERCELDGGHDGPHQVVREWTDEECYNPDTPIPLSVVPTQAAATVTPIRSLCILCEHPFHNGPCGAPMGGFDCDCAQGIEE